MKCPFCSSEMTPLQKEGEKCQLVTEVQSRMRREGAGGWTQYGMPVIVKACANPECRHIAFFADYEEEGYEP